MVYDDIYPKKGIDMDFYEMRALELETARTRRYVEAKLQKKSFWNDFEIYISDVIQANRRMSETYLQPTK